ncbi:MAG: addiction module protein [Verrucomicrobiota bacterium]
MIVENYPELADLDAEQKLILAGELWRSATGSDTDSPELSLEAVRMLEKRLAHFEENPDTGIKWEDLRDGEIAK